MTVDLPRWMSPAWAEENVATAGELGVCSEAESNPNLCPPPCCSYRGGKE